MCCLSVCLFVCASIKTHPNFTKFSVHVTCGHGLVHFDGNAIYYVLPFLWMMLCFYIMQVIGQFSRWWHRGRSLPSQCNTLHNSAFVDDTIFYVMDRTFMNHTMHVSSSLLFGVTGAKSSISDCMLCIIYGIIELA